MPTHADIIARYEAERDRISFTEKLNAGHKDTEVYNFTMEKLRRELRDVEQHIEDVGECNQI